MSEHESIDEWVNDDYYKGYYESLPKYVGRTDTEFIELEYDCFL